MPFTFERLRIPEVVLITPRLFQDERGSFIEAYKVTEFSEFGLTTDFFQDNLSVSKAGVLRGLHYQNPPHDQAKLVRCVHGHIWDVAVDIRKTSPTFGQWISAELTADNFNMLYVPEGFAHGFLVLSQSATVHYKTSTVYHAPSEAGIAWNDPDINITWPMSEQLVISDKDKQLPTLKAADNKFIYALTGILNAV